MANGNAGLMILAIGGLVGYAAYKAGQRRPEPSAPATPPAPLPPLPPTVPTSNEEPLDAGMIAVFDKLQQCQATLPEVGELWAYTASLVPDTQSEANWINSTLDAIRENAIRCFPNIADALRQQPIPYVSVSGNSAHVGDCGCEECKQKRVGDEPCCDACARGVGACACQQPPEDDRLNNVSGGA